MTDATVEEHKEKVLARGRKFKYPLQYSRHRAVINTAIIGVVTLVLAGVFTWLDLYVWQDTGDVAYGITRVLPLSVGEVDGERVRFSDYLMIYRSSVVSIERQQGDLDEIEGGEAIKNEYKRQALWDAAGYAYAMRLARELDVTVTQEDMDEMSRAHRTIGGVEKSRETYEKILRDNFGMSVGEYERMLRLVITRMKVEEKTDGVAKLAMDVVQKRLQENGGNMQEAAGEEGIHEWSGGLVDRDNLDGWRSEVAAKLEVGQISDRFVSQNGDGYYVVKLIQKTDTQVEYESIAVRFGEFERTMGQMQEEGKIKEYIKVREENEEEGAEE